MPVLTDRKNNIVGFCFSCGHEKLFPNYTQTRAFEEAANILGIKPRTLHNIMSYYDHFIEDSGRRGFTSSYAAAVDVQIQTLNTYLSKKCDGKYCKAGNEEGIADAYKDARKILGL